MIVEDERGLDLDDTYDKSKTNVTMAMGINSTFEEYINQLKSIKNTGTYHKLCSDLVDHLWLLKGSNKN